MQLRFATDLSADEYVRQKAWKDARLDCCPLHPKGGCGFARHGTYRRKFPNGTKIARWYCAMGHTTFGLLPDCLSSRLSGSLIEVEAVVAEVENSPSQEAATNKFRPDIGFVGILRWIRRRTSLVQSTLIMLIELFPALLTDCPPLSPLLDLFLMSNMYCLNLEYMPQHIYTSYPRPSGLLPVLNLKSLKKIIPNTKRGLTHRRK